MRVAGPVAAVTFVATVWLANLAVDRFGLVPVGFGLAAPAGVYFAGASFTLRDITQRTLGPYAAAACILLGAALSWAISSKLALASATAFLASESADFATFSLLERASATWAVLLSNLVGLVLDSFVFLLIAFGSLAFLDGQVVGKTWTTLAALPIVLLLRRTVLAAPARS